MPAYKYIYSVADDFANKINPMRLMSEVSENGTLPTLRSVHRTGGDTIVLQFDESLSGAQQTTLNTIISNHNSTAIRHNFFTVCPELRNTLNASYTTIGQFAYAGTEKLGNIDAIEVISKQQNGGSGYSVRIINAEDGTIIAEQAFDQHTQYESKDLGTISNVPIVPAIFDIQMKRNSGGPNKSVYVQQIYVYYNN